MACFADISVSQGSTATYARCGGIFNICLTANLLRNLPVKIFVNQLRFDRIVVMCLWPRFLAHSVHVSVFVSLLAVTNHGTSSLVFYVFAPLSTRFVH